MRVERATAAAPEPDALIRFATPGDARIVAALIDLAGRAHLRNSSYTAWFPGPTTGRIRQIERLVRAPVRTWLHWSLFWVAEVHGRVVAALACYDAAQVGRMTLDLALEQIGWDRERVAALHQRSDAMMNAAPLQPATMWTIDHVAALADVRGRGLVQQLLTQAMTEGSAAGFSHAGVDVRLGNVRAARLFERAGFLTAGEYRCSGPGLPKGYRGVVRMCRPLR